MTGMSILRVGRSQLNPCPVGVGGFKHALVPLIAACVARRGRIMLKNVPAIRETTVFCALLESLGAGVNWYDTCLSIDCTNLNGTVVPAELSVKIHGSLYLLPALIAANGHVRFCQSGGCAIGDPKVAGARPVSHMLEVLRRFGATFEQDDDWISGIGPTLRGAEIDIMDFSDARDVLTGPLVSGATKTAIIAALGSTGMTRIIHPYPKPDVTDLVAAIHDAGAHVEHAQSTLNIEWQSNLPAAAQWSHTLISDISEIITYITLSVVIGMPLTIVNVTVDRVRIGLSPEINILEKMGVSLQWGVDSISISPPKRLRSLDIEVTSVGIYSDHQPFFALMLLRGDRPAVIRERVWNTRFDYARELVKLGAQIRIGDGEIEITPSDMKRSAVDGERRLVARDLRAAACLLIAGLASGSSFVLEGAEHLDRGYSTLVRSLATMGADVRSENYT